MVTCGLCAGGTNYHTLIWFIRSRRGSAARCHFIVNIENNSIIKCLPVGMRGSLYVYVFCICFRYKSLIAIERQIQRCLNNIQKWAYVNGFQFTKSKSLHVFFSAPLGKCHPDLKLHGASILVVNKCKFLGLIFYKKFTFNKYVTYLKDRCMKALNILRVVTREDWGVDCATLLKLYRSDVRSQWECCVRFSLAISPWVSWSCAECGIANLSWSIQNVTSFSPTCGSRWTAPWTMTSATVSTIYL